MRAPPGAEKMISGRRCSSARSAARATFSPTTEPIDPPIKKKSRAATMVRNPSSAPIPVQAASARPGPRRAPRPAPAPPPRLLQLLRVVGESQGINRGQPGVKLHETPRIQRDGNAVRGGEAVVIPALRADLEGPVQRFLVDQVLAAGTLRPQPAGHLPALQRGIFWLAQPWRHDAVGVLYHRRRDVGAPCPAGPFIM